MPSSCSKTDQEFAEGQLRSFGGNNLGLFIGSTYVWHVMSFLLVCLYNGESRGGGAFRAATPLKTQSGLLAPQTVDRCVFFSQL